MSTISTTFAHRRTPGHLQVLGKEAITTSTREGAHLLLRQGRVGHESHGSSRRERGLNYARSRPGCKSGLKG